MRYLKCQDKDVKLNLTQEKLSMLIAGGSRMGKTYFMSLYGKSLIYDGEAVHLIDLGDKWSRADKDRIGISSVEPKTETMRLYFPSRESLQGCAGYIANAIGFSSAEIIRVIKKVIKELLKSYPSGFAVSKLVEQLGNQTEEAVPVKIYERLDSTLELPDIELLVDPKLAEKTADSNIIWDLSHYEGWYINILSQLIVFALYETKRQRFRKGMRNKRLFILVDEFQNIDCTQKSMLGRCLTEGQKYKIYMVLATQFLQGKFSEAVINQFKQGGFQVYFRMTEEEAGLLSRQLVYDVEEQKELRKILVSLPQGHCLLKGSHYVGTNKNPTERLRIVEVKQKVSTPIVINNAAGKIRCREYAVNGVKGL